MKTVGKYRIFYWPKDDERPESIPGWIVDAGEIGTLISKHETEAGAIAAAKRYLAGDKRRATQ